MKKSIVRLRQVKAYGCIDDYPMEHHHRDAILAAILGGTAEMHKLIIGRQLLEIDAIA